MSVSEEGPLPPCPQNVCTRQTLLPPLTADIFYEWPLTISQFSILWAVCTNVDLTLIAHTCDFKAKYLQNGEEN